MTSATLNRVVPRLPILWIICKSFTIHHAIGERYYELGTDNKFPRTIVMIFDFAGRMDLVPDDDVQSEEVCQSNASYPIVSPCFSI
jgi:hypothetical protein